MKKIITTVMAAVALVCVLGGCASKDYSFIQEEWDTNDLSFVSSTPDPNEAYRFIGYFAERYSDYHVQYNVAESQNDHNRIRLVTPSLDRLLLFDYYILEDKDSAKEYYENKTTNVSEDQRTSLKYGDVATLVSYDDGAQCRYVILDGSCVLIVWPVYPALDYMAEIEDFLDYMY